MGVNATGSLTITNGGRVTNSGNTKVGSHGNGTLNIASGGSMSNTTGDVGFNTGATGMVTVDGPGSAWNSRDELTIGNISNGALNITGGGRVSSAIGRIGREAGSSGAVLIDGAGSQWNASGAVTMGLYGKGTSTLTVQNGGTLTALGGVTVGLLGAVRGDGTIVANVVNTTGVIAPSSNGTSMGKLTIAGNYTQSLGGTLRIQLASPTSFDKFAVTGNMTLPFGSISGGGTLEVSLTGGYVPQGSQSFDVLDWGSLSGAFDSVVLPTLGGTLAWDISQLYTTGVLSVVGPPATLAGDFDENGTVNGADLARWKAGFSAGSTHMQGNADADGDVDGADFLVWQRQLGSVTTVAGTAPVPEPVTLTLLVPAALAMFLRRRVAVS